MPGLDIAQRLPQPQHRAKVIEVVGLAERQTLAGRRGEPGVASVQQAHAGQIDPGRGRGAIFGCVAMP